MGDNSKWKKIIRPKKNDAKNPENFETVNLRQKIKKIYQNPKKIPIFENIFDPTSIECPATASNAWSPSSAGAILGREGMTSSTDASSNDASNNSVLQNMQNNIQSAGATSDATFSLGSLGQEITNLLNDLNNIDSITQKYYSELNIGSSINTNELNANTLNSFNSLNVNGQMGKIKGAISQVVNVVKIVLYKIFAILTIIFKSIEYFIVNFNENVQLFVTKLSNALTQNTATATEISTFQDQIQKFFTILLVWIFIYNWYYVVFFLTPGDNIRYTFDTSKLENYSGILYGLIGPSLRTVDVLNRLIIGGGAWLKERISKKLIFFMMFVLFLIMVLNNFQSAIVIDFFNSLKFTYGTSILALFVICIVAYYAIMYVGGIIKMAMVLPANWISIFVGIIIFIFTILYLFVYSIAVSIPLGMIFVFLYIVGYSFFGILIYEGLNAFSILPAISNDISFIEPDLNVDNICLEPPEFEWDKIPKYLGDFGKKAVSYLSVYMFEIIVVLILLSGIGTYISNYSVSSIGKIGMSMNTSAPIKEAFKQLFTWLILINVLLILLIGVFVMQKYNMIEKLYVNLNRNIEEKNGAAAPIVSSTYFRGEEGQGHRMGGQEMERREEEEEGTKRREEEMEKIVESKVPVPPNPVALTEKEVNPEQTPIISSPQNPVPAPALVQETAAPLA